MLDLKKVNKIYLLTGLCLFALVIWSAAYLFCLNSNAYKAAVAFSLKNKIVISELGNSLNFRLGLIDFRVSEGLKNGSAEFTIVASGDKSKADIYFLLIKKTTDWEIQKAVLNTGKENLDILAVLEIKN